MKGRKRQIVVFSSIFVVVVLLGVSLCSVVDAQVTKSHISSTTLTKIRSLVQTYLSRLQSRSNLLGYPILLIVFILISAFEFVVLVEYFVLLFFVVLTKLLQYR